MPQPHSEAARIVGERILAIRHRLALSQKEVANLAEMHAANYGKIERGRANPSVTTLVRIATALDTDPGDLVRGIRGSTLPGRTHQLTAVDVVRVRPHRP